MADTSKNGMDGMAEGPEGDKPMSFFEHLAELRTRLMRAAIATVLGFGGAFFFVDQLEAILFVPLTDAWTRLGFEGQPTLQNLGMLDAFLTDVRIALTFGLGKADRAEKVAVRWPDGTEQEFGPLAAQTTPHLLERR